jgi:hypothetical protein
MGFHLSLWAILGFTLTESSYDWKSEQWTIPIIAQIAKLTSIGDQKISFASLSRAGRLRSVWE